jgi:plastocyanin
MLSLVAVCAVATSAFAKVHVVYMRDNIATGSFFFDPAYIVVSRADTVRWVNAGAAGHTTTSNESLWDSGFLAPGGSFQRQMLEPGPHQYFCVPHEFFGMVGAVSVITHSVKHVQMNDNFPTQSYFFNPVNVTASPGDTIKWTNAGQTLHTATSGTEGTPGAGVLFDSPYLSPGEMFTWVVKDTSAVLPYFCVPHAMLGMLGTITVQPSSVELPGSVDDPNLGLHVRMVGGGSASSVAFRLLASENVTVSVVDARGAAVARLVDGTLPAGPHEVRWAGLRGDGARAASGLYFYDVRIGARRGSAPALLLR